jgi:hypothetical protein
MRSPIVPCRTPLSEEAAVVNPAAPPHCRWMEDAQWSLVEQDRGDAFCARVAEKYWADTGVEPLVFQVEAAPGAGVVNV